MGKLWEQEANDWLHAFTASGAGCRHAVPHFRFCLAGWQVAIVGRRRQGARTSRSKGHVQQEQPGQPCKWSRSSQASAPQLRQQVGNVALPLQPPPYHLNHNFERAVRAIVQKVVFLQIQGSRSGGSRFAAELKATQRKWGKAWLVVGQSRRFWNLLWLLPCRRLT